MVFVKQEISASNQMVLPRYLRVSGIKRKYAVSFLAGAASVLALPPFSVWPVLFLTFPLLFVLLSDVLSDVETDIEGAFKQRLLRTALTGWFFGFGYFVGGLYWMGQAFLVEAEKFAFLMPLAILGMPAFLAIFYALAVLPVFFFRRSLLASIFGLVAGFGGAEWLRSNVLTGFPWNSIGYGLLSQDAFSQVASVVGLYGANFLVVLICLSPTVLFIKSGKSERIAGYIYLCSVLLLFAGAMIWGGMRLSGGAADVVEGVRFRIVQPNIPQKKKLNPSYHPWIFSELLKYSRGSASGSGFDGVTHVIWPEMAVPALLARDREKQKGISELLPSGVQLISGSFRLEQERYRNKVYNSLFVMNHKAEVVASYDKIHLVPFGEYLPLQSFLEALGLEALTRQRGGFAVGSGKRVVDVPGLPLFSPLICYEIIFPNEVIEDDQRPGWLLNITNDAWFGYSTGPYQHLQQSRIRAIEEGLPVVRVANTGVSAIIDGYGRILKSMPLETGGFFDHDLPKAAAVTYYSRWRYYVFPVFLCLILGAACLFRYRCR